MLQFLTFGQLGWAGVIIGAYLIGIGIFDRLRSSGPQSVETGRLTKGIIILVLGFVLFFFPRLNLPPFWVHLFRWVGRITVSGALAYGGWGLFSVLFDSTKAPLKRSFILFLIGFFVFNFSTYYIPAQVIKVVDGDTVKVRMAKRWQGRLEGITSKGDCHVGNSIRCSVRYLGMDAPELDSNHGTQARQENKDLVDQNKVWLELNPDRLWGKYDRLLAYIHLNHKSGCKGTVNLKLVRAGCATCYDGKFAGKYHKKCKKLEDRAGEACKISA